MNTGGGEDGRVNGEGEKVAPSVGSLGWEQSVCKTGRFKTEQNIHAPNECMEHSYNPPFT